MKTAKSTQPVIKCRKFTQNIIMFKLGHAIKCLGHQEGCNVCIASWCFAV